nr:L,D-transpeptidase family protein [Pseudomonas sp. CC6-YY-74]
MNTTTMLTCAITLALQAAAVPFAFASTEPLTTEVSVAAPPLTAEFANDANLRGEVGPKQHNVAVLRAQILLDRARFFPGEIDASFGSNTRIAISGFQKNNGLPVSGVMDEATWVALNADVEPVLVTYTITDTDAAGPFQQIPADMMDKATLTTLGYRDLTEALGEKFHASPRLLALLNPGKDLSRAGEAIVVPNLADAAPLPKAARVVVDKSDSTVTLFDAANAIIAQFPASSGSSRDPLPLGDWKILGVARNPVFQYNPSCSGTPTPATPRRPSRPARTTPSASPGSPCPSRITASMARRSRRRSARLNRTAASASPTGTSRRWDTQSSPGYPPFCKSKQTPYEEHSDFRSRRPGRRRGPVLCPAERHRHAVHSSPWRTRAVCADIRRAQRYRAGRTGDGSGCERNNHQHSQRQGDAHRDAARAPGQQPDYPGAERHCT